MTARISDADVMMELLGEEQDEELAKELTEELASLEKDTAELRLKALLSGGL